MIAETDFIRLTGQLIFAPEKCSWETFTQEQQREICDRAQNHGLSALFVRMLKTRLPEPFYRNFRTSYQTKSFKLLKESKALNDFYRFLEDEKIAYMPVKGADLAFRIYPDQALRTHGDWDILFHKEDCPRLIKRLREQGWQTFSGFEPGNPQQHHHYDRMHNGKQALEIHWTLPGFKSASPEDIWKESETVNEYHHILTPEMNLLLISAHASSDSYVHLSKWKILADAGFILKHDKVDWKKIKQLAERWGILNPAILLGAWSEFFPEGMLPEESFIPEQQKLIYETFEMHSKLQEYSAYEKSMESWRFSKLQWILEKIRSYRPSSICYKYHLSPKQPWKILYFGLQDFFGKVFYALTHLSSENPELKEYYRHADRIKKLAKYSK